MEIKSNDTFDENMICRYTDNSHSKIAKINDMNLYAFSATSPDIFHKNSDFIIPPPSSIDIGYKFIIARDKFITKRVDRVSLFDVFKI